MGNSEINTGNLVYLETLYNAYLADPNSVSSDVRVYFESLGPAPKGFLERSERVSSFVKGVGSEPVSDSPSTASTHLAVQDSIRALMLIRNYRVRGHLHADLDPLKLDKRAEHPELLPEFYGFTDADYDRPIFLDGVLGFQNPTLTQILERLKKTYSSTIGVEFMHIQDPERKSWIQETFESTPFALSPQQKKQLLTNLLKAELFEKFLHTKFQGAKRFGLDGGESLIPGLDHVIHVAANQGTQHIVIGMAHRGRLNVITNIIGKPYRKLFAKFLSTQDDPYALGSGDVKYHLGYSSERTLDGKNVHLSLAANPSHLEAVDPVVLGKVRAEQLYLQDRDRKKVMGILMHGDAAFAGQGLVAETLCLSGLKGYLTGGTLHIIINNQIGFTTSPPHSRSSPYCSDIAKGIQAPIFHVNADDPEAVIRVFQAATNYRERFQEDVVVDLICYRRYGHNESDEPSFTQPLMYKAIAEHPSTATIYANKLCADRITSEEEIETLKNTLKENLETDYKKATAADDCYDPPHWLQGSWKGIQPGPFDNMSSDQQPETGVDLKTLRALGKKIFSEPREIRVNSKILRQLKAKQEMMDSGKGIDWATAEALSFASLLSEGHHVRVSGQDCGRGTFSQRHAVLVDQETEKKYTPLEHVDDKQAIFEVIDSPLAEASVLGFEYGYAGANPRHLVLWEAQFGDFVNGAQVIIDQFLVAGEMKWLRQNGIVLLLPHGFEGQGPEHSSARLERFLQLCGDGNWIVANCSTPANYFHILRRQLKQKYRKPLILMTPKSLLRHKMCISDLSEFDAKTCFSPVISDSPKDTQKIQKVVLCSGKIYYDLLKAIQESKADHIALIRLEQFYPWPQKELMRALSAYKNAYFVWCQEEPENMGAWSFVDRRLENLLIEIQAKNPCVDCIARPASSSPATGFLKRHEEEQQQLIDAILAPISEKKARNQVSALK